MHDDEFRPTDISDQFRMIRDMGPTFGGINGHKSQNLFYSWAKPFHRPVTVLRYHYPAASRVLLLGWEA
jgi:hypothetical protein